MFQADGKPWVGAHVAYTEEDTGDKGHAVVRVLADDECLPLGAEDNFFVGDHAGHAYGVDGDAVNIQYGMKLNGVWLDLHASDFEGNVMTEYEQKFSSKGQGIYRVEAEF